jgi:hypothetical protein
MVRRSNQPPRSGSASPANRAGPKQRLARENDSTMAPEFDAGLINTAGARGVLGSCLEKTLMREGQAESGG